MKPLDVFTPDELSSGMPPDLSYAAYRFLAEGDSWFTLSTLNPGQNANLLFQTSTPATSPPSQPS